MANPDVRRGTMKTALAENLRELMKKKLFEKITIKQICDETGVIRATFYNYFDDKYDCLNWIIHRDFFNNEELLYKGGPKEYFSAVLTVMKEERAFYRVGYYVIGQNSFEDMITCNLADVLTRFFDLKRKDNMLPQYSNQLVASYYAQCLSFIFRKFTFDADKWTVDEAKQMIVDLMGHSFRDYIE